VEAEWGRVAAVCKLRVAWDDTEKSVAAGESAVVKRFRFWYGGEAGWMRVVLSLWAESGATVAAEVLLDGEVVASVSSGASGEEVRELRMPLSGLTRGLHVFELRLSATGGVGYTRFLEVVLEW